MRHLSFVLMLLMGEGIFADWPQFQNTPENTGYAPGAFIDLTSIDTVLKFNMGGVMLATPVILGDTVYAASETGTLFAVNFRTGKTAWTFRDSSGIVSTPAADRKKIYVAARSGRVYGLNRMTGVAAWTFEVDDTAAVFKEIQAPLKLAGNRLYAGCFNGKLYCIDTSGSRKWDLQTAFYIKEGVAIKDSQIVLSSRDEMVYGLVDQGDTCRMAWKIDPVRGTAWGNVAMGRSAPIIVGGLFFLSFVENDGYYWTSAFSLDSGKVLKYFSHDMLINGTGFATTGGGVVFCNGKYFRADSLGPYGDWQPPKTTGYLNFRSRPGDGAPIVLGNAAIHVGGFNPSGLYFYNPVTRARTGSLLMTDYGISSSLAAADSAMFFGTDQGFLFGMGRRGLSTAADFPDIASSEAPYLCPNPFNPSTKILFSLKEAGMAKLRIFDSRGRVVFILERPCRTGLNEIRWDAENKNGGSLQNGLYLARLLIAGKSHTFKITLCK